MAYRYYHSGKSRTDSTITYWLYVNQIRRLVCSESASSDFQLRKNYLFDKSCKVTFVGLDVADDKRRVFNGKLHFICLHGCHRFSAIHSMRGTFTKSQVLHHVNMRNNSET